MNAPMTQPVFPLLRMLAWLTAAIVLMGSAGALVLPGLLTSHADVANIALLAAGIVLVAAILGSLPLRKARDSAQLSNAFFIGMGVRAGIALIAALVAIKVFNLPEVPFVASLMLAYLPALFIETRFIIRFIPVIDGWQRQMNPAAAQATSTPTRTAGLPEKFA